jgi:winged helix-turn-helix protein DUF2582
LNVGETKREIRAFFQELTIDSMRWRKNVKMHTLSKLKQGTTLSDQLVFAGIGWLAREEKLNFTTEGRSVRVCLREHQPA